MDSFDSGDVTSEADNVENEAERNMPKGSRVSLLNSYSTAYS